MRLRQCKALSPDKTRCARERGHPLAVHIGFRPALPTDSKDHIYYVHRRRFFLFKHLVGIVQVTWVDPPAIWQGGL